MQHDLVIPCVEALGQYDDLDPWFDLDLLDAAGLQEVKELCAACPIRKQCLAAADLADRSWAYGIWGGLTPSERRARRRQNRKQEVA